MVFKDKGSKFIGYAFPLDTEASVKSILNDLKDRHPKARHWCYAWKLGVAHGDLRFRANDDGEPGNSAGQPIYRQILSRDITNALVVVVRYFGGVKLGVSGLINAYGTAAQMALNSANCIEKRIVILFRLSFEYKHMNKVMRVVKEHRLKITSQKMELSCELTLAVPKSEAFKVKNLLEELRCVAIHQT